MRTIVMQQEAWKSKFPLAMPPGEGLQEYWAQQVRAKLSQRHEVTPVYNLSYSLKAIYSIFKWFAISIQDLFGFVCFVCLH